MIVVLFAFVFVPIDARTAVIHVPIFCPNRIYTALERGTSPAVASACRIPTDAEEDWMIAVKIAPIAIPASGFWKVVIKLMNTSELWRGTIAAPIISIPMKSTPNPAITSLICLTFSFFHKHDARHADKCKKRRHSPYIESDQLSGNGCTDIGTHNYPYSLSKSHKS